jgi:hypothetical protein
VMTEKHPFICRVIVVAVVHCLRRHRARIIKREHFRGDESGVIAIRDCDYAERADDYGKRVHDYAMTKSTWLVGSKNLTDPLFGKVSQKVHVRRRCVFAVSVNID